MNQFWYSLIYEAPGLNVSETYLKEICFNGNMMLVMICNLFFFLFTWKCWKTSKLKKKIWNIFFCLQFSCTFCEVIAEHFKKRAKCFEKMPNWRQKRQNGGRQLKVCCHYKIIKLLALINALDSYSKSKFDPKWLHLALNVSSKHSVPKKMR